jgi:hypothetical protein
LTTCGLVVHIRAEHLQLFPALLAASDGRQHVEVDDAPAPGVKHMAVERLREDHDFFMRELAGAVNAARELAEFRTHLHAYGGKVPRYFVSRT